MILVIAGVNGAGKSSVVGSNLREKGGNYFNPDEATQLLLNSNQSKRLTYGENLKGRLPLS